MAHKLVVVYTTNSQLETTLVKSRLEAEGIPVQVSQEGAASVYGFSLGPLTEADILVPEEYAAEAKAIIAEMEQNETENPNRDESANPNPNE